MLEHIIEVTIVLFILSMSSEKLIELIKLENVFYINAKFRKETKEAEAGRQKRLLWTSLVVCYVVALSADASIFDMFKHQPVNKHFENLSHFETPFDFIGYFITALFLSLGSKFWHDLLDILLEAKLLRRKLSEEATYRVESTSQLQQLLSVTEGEAVDKAILEYRDKWLSIKGIHKVGMEYLGKGAAATPILKVHSLTNESLIQIPDSVEVKVRDVTVTDVTRQV